MAQTPAPAPRPRASSYPPAPPWHLCSEARAGAGPWPRRLARGGPGRGGQSRTGRGLSLARSLGLEAGPATQLTFAGQSSRVPWPGSRGWWGCRPAGGAQPSPRKAVLTLQATAIRTAPPGVVPREGPVEGKVWVWGTRSHGELSLLILRGSGR